MLPILIVCYLRPKKLELLLNSISESKRKVFIFIDRANEPHTDLNREVFNVAAKFRTTLDIDIHWSNLHQGVARGVPAALDWAFSYVDELVILEDDCLPSDFSFEFFECNIDKIGRESVVIASASSPWKNLDNQNSQIPLTLSSYPLIWGWCTNRASWIKISLLLNKKTPHFRVFKFLLTNPQKIRSICFFYAAVIRVNRKKLSAWDSPVALEMLLKNYKAIISNVNLIQNSGKDEIASHYSNPGMILNQIVSVNDNVQASKNLNNSKFWSNKVNLEIERNVYNLQIKHVLSPLKAFIGL